jgi:hypothetical protein
LAQLAKKLNAETAIAAFEALRQRRAVFIDSPT